MRCRQSNVLADPSTGTFVARRGASGAKGVLEPSESPFTAATGASETLFATGNRCIDAVTAYWTCAGNSGSVRTRGNRALAAPAAPSGCLARQPLGGLIDLAPTRGLFDQTPDEATVSARHTPQARAGVAARAAPATRSGGPATQARLGPAPGSGPVTPRQPGPPDTRHHRADREHPATITSVRNQR